MSVTYGSHMAMRTVIERNIYAQVQRHGGERSSMFGLKGHMGKFDQLEMEDILGNPDESPLMPRETVHARLAKVLIDTEEGMYAAAAQRSGGWVGFQPFEVTEVCDVTDAVKCFTFAPKVANGGIAFTPGQFLSIKVDLNGDGLTAPRHYTITSSPGAPHLQCSVKRVEGGVVSSFMHDTLKPGDTVDLSPPFGCFTPRASTSKAVLLSGGIGVTPFLSFAESLGDKVALVAHVDASPAAHAYADRFAGFPTLFRYASDGGSVAPEALFEEIAARLDGGPSAHEFYICCSPGFQNAMTTTLKASGAKSVFSEAFKGHAD